MHQNIVCAKFSILHTLRCKSYKSDRLTNLDIFFKFAQILLDCDDKHLISRQGRLKSEVKSELCSIVVIIVIFSQYLCQNCGVKSILWSKVGIEWSGVA